MTTATETITTYELQARLKAAKYRSEVLFHGGWKCTMEIFKGKTRLCAIPLKACGDGRTVDSDWTEQEVAELLNSLK